MTPESVLIICGFFLISVLVAVVGYLGKRQLETIINNQDAFLKQQINCRESLPQRFADKNETAEHIRELYTRTDRHEKTLTRHATLLGEGELG